MSLMVYGKVPVSGRETIRKRGEWDMKVRFSGLSFVCVCLIAISLVLTSQSFAEISRESIVGIWPFDEGTGRTVKDSSGHGHNGEFVGDLKWAEGNSGKALEFPGAKDNYVSILPHQSFSIDKYSITAWIKTANAEGRAIVNNKTNYMIQLEMGGNVSTAYTAGGGAFVVTGETVVTNGRWHHVATTYTREFLRLYIDGKLDKEFLLRHEPQLSLGPLAIGGSVSGGFFGGIIDDVGLFNVGLTEGDVNNIMNNGLLEATGTKAVSFSGKLATIWGGIKIQKGQLDRY